MRSAITSNIIQNQQMSNNQSSQPNGIYNLRNTCYIGSVLQGLNSVATLSDPYIQYKQLLSSQSLSLHLANYLIISVNSYS